MLLLRYGSLFVLHRLKDQEGPGDDCATLVEGETCKMLRNTSSWSHFGERVQSMNAQEKRAAGVTEDVVAVVAVVVVVVEMTVCQ
jgi:hypothetical protein